MIKKTRQDVINNTIIKIISLKEQIHNDRNLYMHFDLSDLENDMIHFCDYLLDHINEYYQPEELKI